MISVQGMMGSKDSEGCCMFRDGDETFRWMAGLCVLPGCGHEKAPAEMVPAGAGYRWLGRLLFGG